MCLSVSFTACLTALIFQQYNKGFKDEFKYTNETVYFITR